MRTKERLDKLLTERGITRSRAQGLIMSGKVRVNGQVETKSGAMYDREAKIELEEVSRWAGRGAQKLLRAFEKFNLDIAGKICADIGASTGGFTDVMLERGASKVYAVDVGYGQLLWRLATDPRVVVMDRTNARYLTRADFEDEIEFASCDVSFISLKLILPVLDDIVRDGAVILIKPQFEAGRSRINKGVIREKETHIEVLKEILRYIREETRFSISGLTYSPIKGAEGNIEFLSYIDHRDEDIEIDIEKLVNEAHEEV